jgi:hypothetical protein
MTSTLLKTITLAALLLAGSAMAQSLAEGPGEVCRAQPPAVPAVNWSGKASYRATAKVKDGKVVSVEVSALTRGIDRRASRAMVQGIAEALQAARCQPGDHVFEKTYHFDLPPAATAAAASGTN